MLACSQVGIGCDLQFPSTEMPIEIQVELPPGGVDGALCLL